MSHRLFATLLAAVALSTVGLIAGCGGNDDGGSSGDLDSGVVAKVGDKEIKEGDLNEQVDALVRARGRQAGGQSSEATARRQLRDQALTLLWMREAIEQEAADRGIEVSNAEVEQRWADVSGDQFKTKKAVRRFLGGQTQQDVLNQLRLQTLSERISQQVAEQAGGGKEGEQEVKRFQKEFRERWTERTACADGYAAAGCADEGSSK